MIARSPDNTHNELLERATTAAGVDTFDCDIASFTKNIHQDDVVRVEQLLRNATNKTGTFETEYRSQASAGEVQLMTSRGLAMLDENQTIRVVGVTWSSSRSTTADAHIAAARESARRAEMLSRITGELIGTLNFEEAGERLVRLIVPTLADWAIVTLSEDHVAGGDSRYLKTVASWHKDEDKRAVVESYAHARLDQFDDNFIVRQAVEEGETYLCQSGAMDVLTTIYVPGEAHKLIHELAPDAIMALPLNGREGPVGMLSLCNGPQRGAFEPEDLTTITHVAGRAGIVMDNARLYRQQRDLAEALQRALLTPPPELDNLEIVVRYMPAAQAAQVGGDWYDAFTQPRGATVVVIGDVVGHDTQAAAAMGQVRSIMRTNGVIGDNGPARVLQNVDEVMRTLHATTTATAIVARLDQTDEDKAKGIACLCWSNAGHPPPFVVDANGKVSQVSTTEADVLLGVTSETPRREFESQLKHGSTVVMYTDGLVERRGQPIADGLTKLENTLSKLSQQNDDLNTFCDELLEAMLPQSLEDDVALLAVRLKG